MNEQADRNPNIRSDMDTPKVRAAEYVRMSTEHQMYSTENQAEAIRAYAQLHNMEIVRTYSDSGKSGLKIEGRDGLKRLIEDVEHGDIRRERSDARCVPLQ